MTVLIDKSKKVLADQPVFWKKCAVHSHAEYN